MEIHYSDAVYEALKISNALIMEYVQTSNPNFLLKAIEIQADVVRLLHSLLMNIEEGEPCLN